MNDNQTEPRLANIVLVRSKTQPIGLFAVLSPIGYDLKLGVWCDALSHSAAHIIALTLKYGW